MDKILYGECVWSGAARAVRISGLTEGYCDLEPENYEEVSRETDTIDGDCTLWIGAVGPIKVTACRNGAGQITVRFKKPLNDRILHHFNAL